MKPGESHNVWFDRLSEGSESDESLYESDTMSGNDIVRSP